jgi:DNA-directed RNA polymerase specialized sigma24 family protein
VEAVEQPAGKTISVFLGRFYFAGRLALMTQREFDNLLSRLDADRDQAAAAYNQLRGRLINHCRLKGHSSPEDGADEVLDRVAARLAQGEAVLDVAKYSLGVARLVCLENYRQQERAQKFVCDFSFFQSIAEAVDDRIFGLMARCFGKLGAEEQSLLRDYYGGAEGEPLDEWRLRMAHRMQITLNTLRLRVHRLRLGLEKCLQTNRRLLQMD